MIQYTIDSDSINCLLLYIYKHICENLTYTKDTVYYYIEYS